MTEETAEETTAGTPEETAPESAPETPAETPAEAAATEGGETPVERPSADDLAAVEALLFASGKSVPAEKVAEAAEIPLEIVNAALDRIEAACNAEGRGIQLDRAAGGVRFVSRASYDFPIRRLLGLDGKNKLSIAGLETLAIIAYRQPLTAPEVMEIRGVNSASAIRTLLDRKLITTAGRKEVVGQPFLYKTTKEFLAHFGLQSLADLPKPEELEALYGIEPQQPPDPQQTELFPQDDAAEGDAEPATPDAGAQPGTGGATEAFASETTGDAPDTNTVEEEPATPPEAPPAEEPTP
ncbi:MAG: SMC-Scp complex subunit ScpB [Acidobacteria bacterium]|nr:SMC-Scp complex subunit ScpB [Acidobacteriota bacterium]